MDALPKVVQTQGLVRKYGRTTALHGLDLSIPEGAVFALVGPNGAGKTTLIKVLANLAQPSFGYATVMGEDSKLLRGQLLERLGYISENQELPGWMTVGYYLDYLRPFYPTWDAALEQQLLQMLDVPLDRKLKSLSRGQRMKAAFAGVLSYRPYLVILDEPFSGLDPLVREELIAVLKSCAGQMTFLVSSHDLDEIEGFATHVGFLEKGKMLFVEEVAPLRRRFQRVEFELAAPPEGFAIPSPWMEAQWNAGVYSFAINNPEGADVTRARVLEHFPEARNIQVASMGLRQIFLAVARSRRGGAA